MLVLVIFVVAVIAAIIAVIWFIARKKTVRSLEHKLNTAEVDEEMQAAITASTWTSLNPPSS
jgi:type II secretory pathway pseudopilin PulG